MTPEEEFDAAPTPEEEFEAAPSPDTQPSMATDALPVAPAERKIGEPTERERRWGQIVSFMSGSPLFGTVARAADSLTGQRSMQSAKRATEQFSPKVAGVPVLPLAGGMVATAPAGAAKIGGLGINAARAARVGLQGGIGAVEAADKGGGAGDVALGTATGLAGGAGGELVGAGLTRAGAAIRQPLSDFAESQAVKALLGGGQIVNRVKSALGVRSEPQLQKLGREVLNQGLLAGPLGPRTTSGINDATKRMLAESGDVIGSAIETWDKQAADEAARAAAQGLPSWTRPDTASARSAFDKAVAFEGAKTGTAAQLVDQVMPIGSALEEPNVNTMRRLWDTKTQLGNQAFESGTARVGERAKMLRVGQQAAARDIERQLESRIGPDSMDEVRDAMKRYSLGKRIEGTVEDAATREMSRSGPGLKDWQAAETMGASGPLGLPVAMASKLIRGRGNAAAAVGANAASKVAPTALGFGGGVSRFAVPEAARQSVADPMGPLRQYLGLSPEERRELDVETFEDAP